MVSESAPAMTSTMLLYTLMLPYTFQKVVRPWPEWPIGLRRPWPSQYHLSRKRKKHKEESSDGRGRFQVLHES
jgi:hypothetical protein